MSDNEEKKDLVQGWLDRQLVAARATNWGKDITAKSDLRIKQSQAPHLEI